MVKFSFDSVVFHTTRLSDIRSFYEGKLGFPTGNYEKNGQQVSDFSDSYVNYHIGGGLIGFEIEPGPEKNPASLGDLVIRVSDFTAFKDKLKQAAVPIVKENSFFFIIHDPEGRTLIFEPVTR